MTATMDFPTAEGLLVLEWLGAAFVDAAGEPEDEFFGFLGFVAEGAEGVPIDVGSGLGCGDAVDVEFSHDGLGFAGVSVEDVCGAREVVEGFGGEAEGGDADAEVCAEAAEAIGEGFVLDGCGVDEFAALGPEGDGEGLEEVLAVGVEGGLDAEASAVEAEWGDAEALFEGEHRFVEGHFLIGRAAGFPVDEHEFWEFPEVGDGSVFGEGLAEGEGEAAVDFEVAGDDGTELADPEHGGVDFALVRVEVVEAALC